MQEQLERFFAQPSAENYLRARQCLLARRRRPQPAALMKLQTLFEAGRFADVRQQMDTLLPAWGLAPRLYWLGAAAAWQLGDPQAAELDRFLYHTCLEGILATGDGRRSAPYHITYASDQGPVLKHLGWTAAGVRLVRGPEGLCDVVNIGPRRRLWFALGEGIRDEGGQVLRPRKSSVAP
jgi:hypothetical protein